jgi:glutathione S-transferase
MAEIPHIFHEIDTLKDEQLKEPYYSENPTGSIPMMIQG